MIRKATKNDILEISKTYEELLLYEKEHVNYTHWELGKYPTIKVPELRIPEGTMYVLEENDEICASMVLNSFQAKEYASIDWLYPAKDSEVLVIHTLCIPPSKAKHGYGSQMVNFAKKFATENNFSVIRIDTNIANEPAKKLYDKNGFHLAGRSSALHEGVLEVELVYLEYKL